MRSCAESFQNLILRSLGREYGQPLLPRGLEITLCDQLVLIASGLLWNLYFASIALGVGFFLAIALALAKASASFYISRPAAAFIFAFRGSPLIVQFFFAYELFSLLARQGLVIDLFFVRIAAETQWLTRVWAGALIVLCLGPVRL